MGPDCEDTCCRGWQINLDLPSLVQIQATASPALKSFLDSSLIPHPQPTRMVHAHLRLNPDHACPLLSSDSLCRIQSELGHTALPIGCQTFPRVLHRIDGTVETSLSLSCPTAARLVLLSPDTFQPLASPTGDALSHLFEAANLHPAPQNLFWPIRSLSLAIALDRTRAFPHRLLLLGSLAAALAHGSLDIVQSQFNRPPQPNQPPDLAPTLLAMEQLLQAHPHNDRLRALLAIALHGIDFQPGKPLEASQAIYLHTWHAQLSPFLDNHPWLLENYLVNHIFRNLFPFGWQSGNGAPAFLGEFAALARKTNILLALLNCSAAFYTSRLSPRHVADTIQILSRCLDHSPLPQPAAAPNPAQWP